MTKIRYEGKEYDVVDRHCLGRECLRLHPVMVRGSTDSGTRNTGVEAGECVRRFRWGCPEPKPDPDRQTAALRRQAGIRIKE